MKKSEILFLYETSYNIPNGDPFTGEQRYDDSIVIDKGTARQPRVKDFARTLPERFEFDSFGTDSKGRKKAAQYAKEVRDHKAAHASKHNSSK